jgi:splicing factor 3B subunit 4
LADATVYVGGLDEKVSESLLWELFVQAGPVGKFHLCGKSTLTKTILIVLNKLSITDGLLCLCFVIVNVHMPRDRVSLNHQGYGFVEFISEEDADYAIRIKNMIKV